MKKELSVFLLPICMVACSQDTSVGQSADMNAAVDTEVSSNLPVFAFGEDGSRYDIDIKSGKQTKKEMNREQLVVADESEFDSLKRKYRDQLNSDGANKLAQPVNYYCKAELLAINEDYSEVVTSDGKVLLDDASLLAGCVDVSKNETLAKTTTYTDYPNTHTVNKFPYKLYVETDMNKWPYEWSATGVTAVYVYTKLQDGTVIYVPHQPRYAGMHVTIFKKSACAEHFAGLFYCEDFYDNVNKSGLGYSNNGVPVNVYDFDNHHYGKNQNRTYLAWSIETDAVLDLDAGSSLNQFGAISQHVVVVGQDTIFFRTGMNVTKEYADKFYNKYLSSIDLLYGFH